MSTEIIKRNKCLLCPHKFPAFYINILNYKHNLLRIKLHIENQM